MTFQITFPRIILAEFNTHRVFCLAGDMELEFDLPSPGRTGHRRIHKVRLGEFVDKGLHGARRYAANPKREYDLSWIEPTKRYTSHQAAANMGMANPAAIHIACRRGNWSLQNTTADLPSGMVYLAAARPERPPKSYNPLWDTKGTRQYMAAGRTLMWQRMTITR